jgi:hypothetical protein
VSHYESRRLSLEEAWRVIVRVDTPYRGTIVQYLRGVVSRSELQITALRGDGHPERPTLALRLSGVDAQCPVGYLRPVEGGLVLRLPWEEVCADDTGDTIRRVPRRKAYQVSCPLISDSAVFVAVRLTDQAVRRLVATQNAEGEAEG